MTSRRPGRWANRRSGWPASWTPATCSSSPWRSWPTSTVVPARPSGDFPLAGRSRFGAALASGRRNGDHHGSAYAALGLACLAADAGEWSRAAVLHGVAQSFVDRTGVSWQDLEARYRQESLDQRRRTWDTSRPGMLTPAAWRSASKTPSTWPRAGHPRRAGTRADGGAGEPMSEGGDHRSFRRKELHSHSMVAGGLLVTSRTTRLISGTSLVTRVEIPASTSSGSRAQSAVMASSLVTGRSTMGWP